MKHENFNFKQHGFVGHLAEPDAGSDRAVIVIMGGEQSGDLARRGHSFRQGGFFLYESR